MNGNPKSNYGPIFHDRLRLAVLSRDEWMGIGVAALIAGGLFAMFHFLGNMVADVNSRSAFVWMTARWNDRISFGGADYSHGWLIPFVSAGLIWYKRRELMEAPKAVNNWGLALILGALALHWVGAKMVQTRLSLGALIVLLWAIPFYFFGWKTAKHLLFPVGYLSFCIPLNFLDVISFPLRLFAAGTATTLLNGLGVETIQRGSAIFSGAGGGFSFDVADPCSGLRSLLAMTALTAVYAYVTQNTFWKKWILFSFSIPLAIAGNVARIFTIGLVGEAFGERPAMVIHDYSGYVVFTVAILLMVALGALLNTNFKTLWQRVRAQWAYASA